MSEREELFAEIEQLNVKAMENQKELEERANPSEFRIPENPSDESAAFYFPPFFLRFALSILCLTGFLYLKHEQKDLLGVTPEEVVTVISTGLHLQDFPDSGRIGQEKLLEDTKEK